MNLTEGQLFNLRQLQMEANAKRIRELKAESAELEESQGWNRWRMVDDTWATRPVPRLELDVTAYTDNTVVTSFELVAPRMFEKKNVLRVRMGLESSSNWSLRSEVLDLSAEKGPKQVVTRTIGLLSKLLGGASLEAQEALKLPLYVTVHGWLCVLIDGAWSAEPRTDTPAPDALDMLRFDVDTGVEALCEHIQQLDRQVEGLREVHDGLESMKRFADHPLSQPLLAIPAESDSLPVPRLEMNQFFAEEHYSQTELVLVVPQNGWHVRVALEGSYSRGDQSSFAAAPLEGVMPIDIVRNLPRLKMELAFLLKPFGLPGYVIVDNKAFEVRVLEDNDPVPTVELVARGAVDNPHDQ